jgi:hypothetical protein
LLRRSFFFVVVVVAPTWILRIFLVSSSSSAPCGFDDWLILYYWWNLCKTMMIPEHPQSIGRGNQRPSLSFAFSNITGAYWRMC